MVSGLPKHTTEQDADEIGEVADAQVHRHQRIPRTPAVDVAQLLASGLAHLARARKLRGAAGAWLQAAQLALVEDPTPATEAAVRRARQALDASEADEDLAAREVASYRIRVDQADVP
jgi:hypothetical protein